MSDEATSSLANRVLVTSTLNQNFLPVCGTKFRSRNAFRMGCRVPWTSSPRVKRPGHEGDHLRLAPRLTMSVAVPLRPAYPCGVNSDFYLYMMDFILKRW